MTELLHPPWCDPAYCDAAADGAHRSVAVPLDLSTVLMWGGRRAWVVYLYQPAAPVGAVTTYVRLRPTDGDDDPLRAISVPLGTVEDISVQLADLIAQAVQQDPAVPRAAQQEQPKPMPPNVEGWLLGWGGCRRKSNMPARFAPRTERVSSGG